MSAQEARSAAQGHEPETRWTAFEGEIPVAHDEARYMAIRKAREKGFRPTKVVKRLRAYPFTHLDSRVVRDGE